METEHLQVVFDQELTVKFKSLDKDERRISKARLSISWATKPLLRNHTKILLVQLTEDTDLFFLYTLEMSEEEFYQLKQEQSLLVDFVSFPMKLIELLHMCITCERDTNPKFLLQLHCENGKSAVLNIIETNPFKYLTHLSLNLVSGNDAAIKKYLVTVVTTLKDQLSKLKEQWGDMQHRLETRLQETTSSLEKAHAEHERSKLELTDMLKKMQEKSMLEYNELKSRVTAEKDELLQHHEYDSKRWQERISDLEGQNRLLAEMKVQLDGNVRDLIKKNQDMEHELQRAVVELETFRSSRREFESTRLDYERELGTYRVQLTLLEQQLREKNEDLQRTSESSQLSQEQRKKAEDALELYKTQNDKLEETLKRSKDEINKANEIIKKLQTDFRDTKAKLKLKSVITSQQEKLLEDRQHMMDTLHREVQELKNQLGLKDQEIEHLNTQLKSSTKKLDESKQIIETNENVIAWLNKQVNEKLTLGVSEFDKYGSKHTPGSQPSSDTSVDSKHVTTGSFGSLHKVVYKPTSSLQNENKPDPASMTASLSDSSSTLGNGVLLASKVVTDEGTKPSRYPLKAVAPVSKLSSYF